MDSPIRRTIIFDLDGTLVDVVPIFIKIFNQLAADFNYAPIKPEEVSKIRTLNLRKFLFTKLGLRFWRYRDFLRRGQAAYFEYIPEINFFTGMPELFSELKLLGYTIGIISSNTEPAIVTLLRKHSLIADFITSTTLSGKAKTIKETLQTEGISPDAVAYVGDELRDINACRTAGVPIIAVTWGLNDKESLKGTGATLADTPAELRSEILRMLPPTDPSH